MENKEINKFISLAVEGNSEALEKVLSEINDFIFNLSLRMLGTIHDAEDATQEILIKVMLNLSSFKKESAFRTWVYKIAVNYLFDYKKSMFYKYPLSFEYYADDIKAGYIDDEDIFEGDKNELSKELKLSCTNVMLQCLDAKSRCVFIIGTMFDVDSKTAGEILDMTPENYRQILHRARKKMAKFLSEYCGLSGTGLCNCKKRIGYAVSQHRLDPKDLEYSKLETLDEDILEDYMKSMEAFNEKITVFEDLPKYNSNINMKSFINDLVTSKHMKKIKEY
ncbi:RNA polymerase sigma factor [uncultured Anaerofustis sp.]|uniref:RNA polymerase sigma factor n=1 Tax=uncultured Anaerofustis sp. TaxID=904996 RepID=UPI0025DF43B3|nr:RNA polymerase sigma factor [uncultured Anaerofustis sp.]